MQIQEYRRIKKEVDDGKSLLEACKNSRSKCVIFRRMRKKLSQAPINTSSQEPVDKVLEAPIIEKIAQNPIHQIDGEIDVTAEILLKYSKIAILREIRKPEPKSLFVDLAIKICKEELPDWASNRIHKQGIDDYQKVFDSMMSSNVETFKILPGGNQPTAVG